MLDVQELQRVVREEFERQRQFEADSDKQLAFERDKAVFKENSEHLRSLNKFLWQVPLIAMTLTGGLWYGISHDGMVGDIRRLLLAFAFVANSGLILVMLRVRYVFERILDAAKSFNPPATANTEGKKFFERERLVVTVFCVLMGLAALISLVAAVAPEKLFRPFPPTSANTDSKALKDRFINQRHTN